MQILGVNEHAHRGKLESCDIQVIDKHCNSFFLCIFGVFFQLHCDFEQRNL